MHLGARNQDVGSNPTLTAPVKVVCVYMCLSFGLWRRLWLSASRLYKRLFVFLLGLLSAVTYI